jgi:proton-dependent oligopeptide transporter, POT family
MNTTTIAKQSNHPKGLYVLFFTEMWERFGYYLMLGIFSLYMLDSAENGGMGFSSSKKSDIYGTYIGLVYLTPFIGGLLADRLLGYRKSIIIGGILMAMGYLGLSLPSENSFYISLLLIILGNGFFKPNISTLVGNLYNNKKYSANKDAGFNIFYMGINIGAFVCNFVAAFMRINYGWGYAFAAAGVGMLIAIVIFISGSKHIKDADVRKPLEAGDMPTGKILGVTILPMIGVGILGYLIPGNIFGTDTNDAFLFGCMPVAGFFVYLWAKANTADKRPIAALLSVFACIIIFWAVFHQNGDALTEWAEHHTDREMSSGVASVSEKIGMNQTVTYNAEISHLTDKEFESYMEKESIGREGLEGEELKNFDKKIGSLETSRKYFHNLESSKLPKDGSDLKLFSAELYQSINPFWVILLTPLVVGFFGMMRRKGKEPSTAAKITLGLFITALSAFVMVACVKSMSYGHEKASSLWLIASYGVITVGELCLSPMGLSLVSKLSPPRITALMMGGFFLSTSIGNKLSGVLSGMWNKFDDKSNFFLMNFVLVMIATIMLLLLLKWLNSVLKEKNVQ